MKQYSFVSYSSRVWADGIYNGRYNFEPAIIGIKGGVPNYISFVDGNWDKEDGQKGKHKPSSIFKKSGILHSSVELLVNNDLL